jgi:hypothetical protein
MNEIEKWEFIGKRIIVGTKAIINTALLSGRNCWRL